MKGRTFAQVVEHCALRGITIEQIALRKMTLSLGHMRWTLRLMNDALWYLSP